MNVRGHCDPRFLPVRDEFERNLAERSEVGASVCVTLDGAAVVDLWGGLADRHAHRPWERDTIGVVFSCTKGAVAACALLLASRGKLDLDALVADYWPEFAANGQGPHPGCGACCRISRAAGDRTPLRPGATPMTGTR